MISELSIYGVFLSGALVTAILAVLLLLAARRLLFRVGFYDVVWHRHLVDVALFVILWAGTALATSLASTLGSFS
jgi:hypothetical protein